VTASQNRALLWGGGFAIVVVVVVGIALTIAVGNFSEAVDNQTEAIDRLTDATDRVNQNVDDANKALALGRYERQKFQSDQRRLVCIDLQDGDTGATDEQYAECAEDYIKVPPKPEGYTS
jgi:type II secretory pathway pseudopilin PulG